MDMSATLIEKLLESFHKLDDCISVTREVLSTKDDVSSDVLQRVEQYSQIVEKQRHLAMKLKSHLASRDWDEVGRHIRLINALSSMIRDDAEEILRSAMEGEPGLFEKAAT